MGKLEVTAWLVRVRFTSRALCKVTHSSQVYIRTALDDARQGISRLVVDTKDTCKDNGDRETMSRLSRYCEAQKQFASRIANHTERVKSIAHQCLCLDNLEVLTYSPGVAHHCLGSFIRYSPYTSELVPFYTSVEHNGKQGGRIIFESGHLVGRLVYNKAFQH